MRSCQGATALESEKESLGRAVLGYTPWEHCSNLSTPPQARTGLHPSNGGDRPAHNCETQAPRCRTFSSLPSMPL